MLHTPWSCPHWRSTHALLCRFDTLSTIWSWARHVAYTSIMPTLEINTSLPLSIWFAWYYMIMSTSRCILHDNAHIGDQHISSFVDSFRLVLHDHEHVTLHTPRSCPHWRSTHPFLRRFHSLSTTRLRARHVAYSLIMPPFLCRFDSLSTTWSWARHVAYSSIMPTLEINTSLPSSIRFT
jgi:hypothetical protein